MNLVLLAHRQEAIMTSSKTLSPKEQTLVGIGAAIAAGCQPCARSLIKAARAAGACERGIRLAIESGLAARAHAAEAMALWAETEQGQTPIIDDAFRQEKERLAVLIAAGATFAANSTATLASHVTQAQAHDWTDVQIGQALNVSHTVARTAAEKVEAAVTRLGFSVAEIASDCREAQRAPDGPLAPGGCECTKAARDS
jgi:AhpD family alkylhydroperoxidase